MRRFRACLMAYLEGRHAQHAIAYNARHPRTPGHGAVTTKPPSSTSSGGGAVRSTPAPHPTPRPDEMKEIQ